jgi:hypothetical protein
VKRHVIFWAVYCTYYYLQGISPDCVKELRGHDPFIYALNSVCCFVPACVLCVYVSLYVLYPRLAGRKYGSFLLFFLLLFPVCVVINYFASSVFFAVSLPYPTGQIPFMRKFALGFLNSQNAMIAGSTALLIKLTRSWFLQRKENMELARKRKNSLRMQKSRIHPDLLLRWLADIRRQLKEGRGDASRKILHLSDLLSCWLYEDGNRAVPLTHEVNLLQKLMLLEESEMEVSGDVSNLRIYPMTLLPFLQAACGDVVAVSLSSTGRDLVFQLNQAAPSRRYLEKEEVNQAITRLKALYGEHYILNIPDNESDLTVSLTIRQSILSSNVHEPVPIHSFGE